jgi:hypothetical protein
VRTRVGYAGGTTPAPTYHSIGDHAEAFQLDYDSSLISYEQLRHEVFGSSRPVRAGSGQYRHGEWPNGVRFTLAEDYHQKYYLRHDKVLMRELEHLTPAQLVESTVAARLNGFVAGRGTLARLRDELPTLGISEDAQRYLERLVSARAAG